MHPVSLVKFPKRLSVPCVPLSPRACAPLSSVCCSAPFRMRVCARVWENPLSLLRCSSSGELSALIGRLRAQGASVMHAPALALSLSLSSTLFLTGCVPTIIFITSDLELTSFLTLIIFILINTSILFSPLHTDSLLLCFPVFLEMCLLLSAQGCTDIVNQSFQRYF